MAQNQILPLGSGLGAIKAPSLQGDANEAAFRKDAESGGLLSKLLGMYPTQTEAINARKSAQEGILGAIKNLTSGTGSINPNLAGAAMDGTGVSGMPDPSTYDVENSLDIFNPDPSAGGIGSEIMPLTGGGDQPGDATFGGTIPEPRDQNLDVDIGAAGLGVEPPAGANDGEGDVLIETKPTIDDGNDMTALEEAQQKEDSGQSRALGQLSGYQELLKSSMKSYNDMMGLAPNEEQSIEDYKKQFSEATGIDISGEPDNRAALMSFGFALMQNKAGKGFNVGKMLSSVGEAGEAALPAMEKARSDAKAAQIAAGKYALSSRKGDKDARSKFIIDQTQRLQDKTSTIYASELKRIEAMSDTKDKYRQERILKQMKLKNDAEIQFMKLDAKYATGKYKLENKTTQQPIESLKGLKYTVGKNQNGQTVFMFPKDDARKFGQALSDVKEGKFALTGIESRLQKAIEDGRGSGGVSVGILQEWGQGVASSFGVEFNQEPVFEKRKVDIKDANGNITGTEIREVFTGEYKTDDRPLTEAKAIRDRVIAQFKRFLTQETGNGISNVDIQNIQNLLGNVDFMKNPQDALFRIREAKKIFEQREDAITGQLNLFDDQKRYSTPEQYADTRREISKSIVGAFKNKEEIEDAFGGSVTKDKDGMLTYNFTKR
tara:strand:- start:675 stop:2657 length:1983 start_codon:yes stop_codon:yes gene_type:complete